FRKSRLFMRTAACRVGSRGSSLNFLDPVILYPVSWEAYPSMRRLCLRNVLGSLRNRSSSAMAGVLSWQAAGEHRRPGMRLPRPVAPDYTLVMANRGTSAPRWHGFSHGREGVVGSGQRAKGRAPSGMAGPFPQAPHQAAPLKVDALAGQEVRR